MARLFLLLLALWATGAAAQAQGVPEWRPPIFPAPAGAVRLEARGVRPDTGADVAEAVNAVLKGLKPGQTLLLQAGTYRLSKPVRLPSGVSLQGPQDAQGQPLATLEATHVFRGPDRQMPPLVANANWSAEGAADRMIRVAALRLRHETYGVELRRVEDATIEGNDIASPQPGVRSSGILVRAGDAELVVVRGNRVADVRGFPAIAVGPNSREEGGNDRLPARVVVEGNDLRGNFVSRTGGVVRAAGVAVEVRGNRQTGNGFEGGGTAPGLTLCRRSTPAQEPVVAGCAD